MTRVQGRKWQITINNPLEHGFDHERIKNALHEFTGLLYFCMCDEEGDECETLHTHVFFVLRNPCTAERVNKLFPSCHRERPNGTSAENRAYVLKDGAKFGKDAAGHYEYTDASGKVHRGVNFSDTFEEEGEIPVERPGKSRDADKIVELLKNGASNVEIVDAVSSAYTMFDRPLGETFFSQLVSGTKEVFSDSLGLLFLKNLDVQFDIVEHQLYLHHLHWHHGGI